MSSQACKIDRSHLSGFNYGLIKLSDMPDEMRSEVKEAVVTAIEKFPDNYEGAAKLVGRVLLGNLTFSWLSLETKLISGLEAKNSGSWKQKTGSKTLFAKEMMDKKFGTYWHCIMGEGFGFEITYELKHLMYMYFGGYISVLVFKAL